MSRNYPLRFDALEAKMLLAAHAAAAAPHVDARPMVLDGTLAVDNNAASVSESPDGGTTTSTPVAGRFGTLGELRGTWNETADANGDTEGFDTIRLHNAQGTLLVAFNNQDPGALQKSGKTHYYEDAQDLVNATGTYKGVSESGTIKLVTNSADTALDGLTLQSKTS